MNTDFLGLRVRKDKFLFFCCACWPEFRAAGWTYCEYPGCNGGKNEPNWGIPHDKAPASCEYLLFQRKECLLTGGKTCYFCIQCNVCSSPGTCRKCDQRRRIRRRRRLEALSRDGYH